MKIGTNYNQSFGLKIENNDAYKKLETIWRAKFKPREVEKALAKIRNCDKDTFELSFTDLKINTKTLHTNVEYSYTNGPYKKSFPTPYAIRIVKDTPLANGKHELLNPKEVADDIIEGLGYYKKSIRYYLGI